MKKGYFEVFKVPYYKGNPQGHVKLVGERFHFRLKSANGKIICQSEGYTRKQACLKGIQAIKDIAANAEIWEV